MSVMQIIAVAITIGLNALDGFDVLAISFASPGISREWGIEGAALGTVLMMELAGMAIGSIFLGGVADKIGRRPTMLGCLVVMATGMFMVTTATTLVVLSFWRVITGLGIGGMLASINAVAAEYSSAKRRHLSVAIMSIGYPLGAVFGGMVASHLLKTHDWRAVFYFGGAVTLGFIPLVWFFVPETVGWLIHKQPARALEKVNASLRRMGHSVVSSLPTISADLRGRSAAEAFAPVMIAVTLIVTAAYFFHITTFYFVLKWVPKIVTGMGFAPSSAADVLVWANAGGATGGAVVGLLAMKFSVKRLTLIVMVLSTVAVIFFGRSPADLGKLSLICFVCGFFTNGAIVGMYALFAQAFPARLRAFGTGFAIGVGRGGSALAPIIGGYLFDMKYGLPTVAFVMALGSLVAAIVLSFLKLRPDAEAPIASDSTDRVPNLTPSPSRG